jgi:2-polyprenyl-3-methyl-5-hydroxy-6-metoxy-1,4-benzoquinol methylase
MNELSPAWLMDEFRAFERTLALRTAVELNLFTRIGRGSVTIPELANSLRASGRGLRVLCDSLTVSGHLSKHGSRYGLTLNSRLYLSEDSPTHFGSAVKFLASDAYVDAFCDLRHAVKRGRASSRKTDWTEFARWMAPLASPVAEFAAEALRVKSAGPIQVLDVAAGHGLYGLAVAACNSEAHIFALDSAPVLQIAQKNARKAGVSKRYHPLPGDLFKGGFGGPYDLVLAANVAHHLDPSGNVKLFRKCRSALKPGGKLALLDFVVNDDRVTPAADASFALHLFATGSRDVYTFKEYRQMLGAAGFRKVRRLGTGGYGRWITTAS